MGDAEHSPLSHNKVLEYNYGASVALKGGAVPPWQCGTCTEDQEKLGLLSGLLSQDHFPTFPFGFDSLQCFVCVIAEFSHCALPDI